MYNYKINLIYNENKENANINNIITKVLEEQIKIFYYKLIGNKE